MRWLPFAKLFRKKMASQAVDLLNKETLNIMNFFESCQIPLKRYNGVYIVIYEFSGLYLCYMKLHSTMNSIRVVVPDNLPSMLPFVHVRDNPHVTKEEWEWVKVGPRASNKYLYIQATDLNVEFSPTRAQLDLHGQLSTAIQTLLHDLDIDCDLVPGHRLYHAQILEPSDNVSIILVVLNHFDVIKQDRFFLAPKTSVRYPVEIPKLLTMLKVEDVAVPYRSPSLKCVCFQSSSLKKSNVQSINARTSQISSPCIVVCRFFSNIILWQVDVHLNI